MLVSLHFKSIGNYRLHIMLDCMMIVHYSLVDKKYMNNTQERRQGARGLSIKDLDRFGDLQWEQDIALRSRQLASRRQQPVNLTSKIEDYLKSHF